MKAWDILGGWQLGNFKCWSCCSCCWPCCVAGAILQAQTESGFQVNPTLFFFPSAQKEFSLGTVSFALAIRNAGMEEYWLFWHDCCLASETREAHVSLGSPFCRQLNPSCCQEVCLFVWVVFLVCTLSSPSYIPACHPLLSVRVLSFLGKASQNVFPSWAFPPKQISRNWASYLCVFPSLELSEPRKKCSLGLLSLECSVRDACSKGDVFVHLLVSCKQRRDFWECLKLLLCCGRGLAVYTDNHCQASTQHSKVPFPLNLLSSIHIQC